MKRIHLALALLLAAPVAHSQTVIQSGPWQPGHLLTYYPLGAGSSVPLVIDGGAAGGMGQTVQGVSEGLFIQPKTPTGPYSTNICDYDVNPASQAGQMNGWHYLCFSPDSSGAGLIAFGAVGATPIPLNFNVNGSVFPVGGSAGSILFPTTVGGSTNSGGVGYFSNATTFASSATLAANFLMIGGGAGSPPSTTNTGTGVLTAVSNNVNAANGLPTINGSITTGHALAWGPGITDGGVFGGLTIGTTPIASGSTGYIEYDNGGILGELPITGTAGNVVLSNSPSLVTPDLGTPSAVNLTSGVGLPISTGVTGLGTGVATALAGSVNVSGGVPILNGTPTVGNFVKWSASGLQDAGPSGATLTVGTTPTSGGIVGGVMFDTGSLLQEDSTFVWTSPSLSIPGAYIVGGTPPTATGTGATCAGTASGGATVGIITLSGACAAADTIAMSSMPTVPTGYVCDATDRTQPATLVYETSSTVNGMTFTVSGTTSGATDILQYKCAAY